MAQAEDENEIAIIAGMQNAKDTQLTTVTSRNVTGKAKTVGKGAATGLAVYGIDLGIDLAAGYSAMALSAEAALAASLATGGLIVGGAVVGSYKLYKIAQNKATTKERQSQKVYNNKVHIFNDLKAGLEMQNQRYKLIQRHIMDEQKRINKEFKFERENNESKVIVAIGPTGAGKSLFCNRMLGDNRDVDDISGFVDDDGETANGKFVVADPFDIESQTVTLQIERASLVKVNQDLHTDTGTESKQEEMVKIGSKVPTLTIVDTPGAFDSKNGDDSHQNTLSKYFRGCGGINMFCVFFKFVPGGKFDANMIQLLQSYQRFYGRDFWSQCVIIITNCDRAKNASQKWIDRFNGKLNKLKNAYVRDLFSKVINYGIENEKDKINEQNIIFELFQFGKNNFKESRQRIVQLLMNKSSKFYNKFNSISITSPMEELNKENKKCLEKMKVQARRIHQLKDELDQEARNLRIDVTTGKKRN